MDDSLLDVKDFREGYAEKLLRDALVKSIKKLREERDWTQTDLAKRLGVTPQWVSYLESGRRRKNGTRDLPRLETLLKIANIFDVALLVHFAPIRPAEMMFKQLLRTPATAYDFRTQQDGWMGDEEAETPAVAVKDTTQQSNIKNEEESIATPTQPQRALPPSRVPPTDDKRYFDEDGNETTDAAEMTEESHLRWSQNWKE